MIRRAKEKDLPEILKVYEKARIFMRENGNPNQWGNTYPPVSLLQQFLQDQTLYVVTEENKDRIHGCFYFALGEDETYKVIEEGSWASNQPYGTIHCVANDGQMSGMVSRIVSFCKNQCAHLRIDTHKDNQVMQHVIEKNGFERRGIIYTKEHSPRIAYELVEME